MTTQLQLINIIIIIIKQSVAFTAPIFVNLTMSNVTLSRSSIYSLPQIVLETLKIRTGIQ